MGSRFQVAHSKISFADTPSKASIPVTVMAKANSQMIIRGSVLKGGVRITSSGKDSSVKPGLHSQIFKLTYFQISTLTHFQIDFTAFSMRSMASTTNEQGQPTLMR